MTVTCANASAWTRSFNNVSYPGCGSAHLLDLIISFWNCTHQYCRVYCHLPGKIGRAEDCHRRLLSALEAGDPQAVGNLIKEHVQESMESILAGHPREELGLQ